jgi:hypothetical protein
MEEEPKLIILKESEPQFMDPDRHSGCYEEKVFSLAAWLLKEPAMQ